MINNFPIWLCVVRQEPIMNHIGCTRVLIAEKGTIGDIESFCRKYDLYNNLAMPFGANAMYMYFHREPDDYPVKDVFSRTQP